MALVQFTGRELAWPGASALGALEEENTVHLCSERLGAVPLTPEFSKCLFTLYQELLVFGRSLLCLEFAPEVVLELLQMSRA